jgi:hypothetical protein
MIPSKLISNLTGPKVKNRLLAGILQPPGGARRRQALRIGAVVLRLYGHPIRQAGNSYANRRLSGHL